MRSISLFILMAAAACGSVSVSDGDGGADTGPADHTGDETCEPGSVSCTDTTLSVCGADGRPTTSECPLGCFDDTRCADLVASNDLTAFLDDAQEGPDVELPAGTVIATDDGDIDGDIDGDGSPLALSSVLLGPTGGGGVPVRVFAVRSLTISGDVTAVGGAALAFVSTEDIAIGGHVLIRAGRGIDGTGGDEAEGECFPEEANYVTGRGGGGFGERGGSGGSIVDVQIGGAGGPEVGSETLVPLRGGGGSTALPAVGGGAIQLVSQTAIHVEGGSLDAGGQGGGVRQGGGAGGGILLEAPVVVVAGEDSAIAANGGGGGCAGSPDSPAEDGRLDDRRAAGCQSSVGRDGGQGGAGNATGAGLAGQSVGCGFIAAAGGGGVGRIRVNTADGTFAAVGGAIVSPPASVGTLGGR